MGEFSMVYKRMWHDPAFRELDTDARCLFLWTWTNPQEKIGGLYHASVRAMADAMGDPTRSDVGELERRVEAALEALAAKPLVAYDYDLEVVWVVNRAKHSITSSKVAVCVKREVELVTPGPLRDRFLAMYGKTIDWRDD